MRFVPESFRVDDLLGLTHRVRDTSRIQECMHGVSRFSICQVCDIADDCMSPADAAALADAMNSLDREFNP